jgi:hypothetical protein
LVFIAIVKLALNARLVRNPIHITVIILFDGSIEAKMLFVSEGLMREGDRNFL